MGQSSQRGQGSRLIVLAGPGAPARELHLPRAWRTWLLVWCALSVGGSLMLGRKARAWVDDAATPARLLLQEAGHERDVARLEVVHVPLSRLPPEPEEQRPGGRDVDASLTFRPDPGLAGQKLELFDVNAKQALSVRPFGEGGAPDDGSFASLSRFLRCRRTGSSRAMHPELIALLTRIARDFGSPVLQVISAHRIPDGVVTRDSSQHVRGTAADIRIAGVSVERLAQRARALGAQGVGIYPAHRFVHVDVRARAYSWRGEPAPAKSSPDEALDEGEVDAVEAGETIDVGDEPPL